MWATLRRKFLDSRHRWVHTQSNRITMKELDSVAGCGSDATRLYSSISVGRADTPTTESISHHPQTIVSPHDAQPNSHLRR